ncbi:MAG: ABA4-like family protein [Pseudomonadales bacterium]|nr:ABA4-like family protein [Pseudomonadales bacterium]
MPADTVYTLINAAVLPFWLLLLIAPHARATNLVVHSGLVPVLLGAVYTFYLFTSIIGGGPEGAGMSNLEGLLIAFSNPDTLVGAWSHYLIFDLFVGAWLVRDAKRESIHHLAIVVPLVLTLMAGPLGLLIYLAIRGILRRRFTLVETT